MGLPGAGTGTAASACTPQRRSITAPRTRSARSAVTLQAAYAAHPDRFRRQPTPPSLPTAAWINQPTREALIQND